jgi:hypothetical protein
MSLYRYVTAKDDLLVLMNEEGIGLPPDHEVIDDDWRTGLHRWLMALKNTYEAHPWLIDIPITGIPVTPNNLAWLDWGLRILQVTSLTPDQAVAIVLMLSGMGRWEATISRAAAGSEQAGEQLVLRELVTESRYPGLFAAVAGGAFDPADETDPFLFSTARVLDGIAAHLGPVERPRPDEAVASVPAYQRDQRIKDATQKRREAEGRLRDARKREVELIKSAVEKARRESARAGR